MNLFKLFSISFLVFCSILLGSVAFADETTVGKSEVIANINIYETKINFQEGNAFKISFDISNRKGMFGLV